MKTQNLFELLSKLSNVHRYSTHSLRKTESVLEHTGSVCIIATLIGYHIKNSIMYTSFDIGELLCKSALHDIEEAITGDIPRSTKYGNHLISSGVKQLEYDAVKMLVDDLNLDKDIHRIWSDAKVDFTGLIVRIADILAVTYKTWTEIIQFNNYSMVDVAKESNYHYSSILHDIDILLSQSRDDQQYLESLEYLRAICHEAIEIGQEAYNYASHRYLPSCSPSHINRV